MLSQLSRSRIGMGNCRVDMRAAFRVLHGRLLRVCTASAGTQWGGRTGRRERSARAPLAGGNALQGRDVPRGSAWRWPGYLMEVPEAPDAGLEPAARFELATP